MGPLAGIRVVEFAGLGPAPFCAMLLADLGAQVIRLERPGQGKKIAAEDVVNRNRPCLEVDLKSERGRAIALRFIDRADILLEGFRPGVMERLGLGPDQCAARNARLVYGRMTGWGQHGPLAQAAGHDINYIALSGALYAMGEPDRPPRPPLNLVGDYGGGAMLLAVGVLAALLERQQSGKGQVVDAAMTDGSALLMSLMYGMKAHGQWQQARGGNLLDGSAHFYRCYRCKDGKFLAVGALEAPFYQLLVDRIGLAEAFSSQRASDWATSGAALEQVFASKNRDEWCALLEGSDACVAPVLDMEEAPRHPHNSARKTFVKVGDVEQPAPAPRFSRSQVAPPAPAANADAAALSAWGFNEAEIRGLK